MRGRDEIVLVLLEPQQSENVGAVLRVMLNFGLGWLRLVRPGPLDPARLEVVAHRSGALVGAMESFDDLGAALADVTFVVGATARARALARPVLAPRAVAGEVAGLVGRGERVALLFGREDTGLPNSALDHCHALVTIPTAPDYASLNLAQAVLVVAYELFLAMEGAPGDAAPTAPALPAAADLDAFFATLAAALTEIGFLKPGQAEARLRRLRTLLTRARPDRDELRLLHAVFHQVRRVARGGR